MALLTRARDAATGLRPRVGEHPGWCARGQHCGLGEHRAQPVILDLPGQGRVVLTRVLAADGQQHAEVRTRIVLAAGEDASRAHLMRILTDLEAHLQRVTRAGRRQV
jgi:hypothetical protein